MVVPVPVIDNLAKGELEPTPKLPEVSIVIPLVASDPLVKCQRSPVPIYDLAVAEVPSFRVMPVVESPAVGFSSNCPYWGVVVPIPTLPVV